jgi:hypothetical protein
MEGRREGGREGGTYLQGRVLGLGLELLTDAAPPTFFPDGQGQHLPVPAGDLAAREEEGVVLV